MSDKKKYSLMTHPRYGFQQISPTPSPEEISSFYAAEFYAAYPRFNDSDLAVQTEDQEWLDDQRADICDRIESTLGANLTGLRILDVGCGWGQNLLYFKKRGMDCYGFDPAPEAVAYAQKQGLHVVTAGMETMNVFPKERFDVVTLFNVLEHLADPEAVLQDIRKSVLRKGGLIVIDVPNEFNPFQECANELYELNQWWVIPPGHLNYFSATSLQAVLKGTGYSVRYCESSFPLEMFLLCGDKYVGDGALGKLCHKKRKAFETNLRRTGRTALLHRFYQALGSLNLGRQVIAFATSDT